MFPVDNVSDEPTLLIHAFCPTTILSALDSSISQIAIVLPSGLICAKDCGIDTAPPIKTVNSNILPLIGDLIIF